MLFCLLTDSSVSCAGLGVPPRTGALSVWIAIVSPAPGTLSATCGIHIFLTSEWLVLERHRTICRLDFHFGHLSLVAARLERRDMEAGRLAVGDCGGWCRRR